MSTYTPKRALTRPRPSLSSKINTASSPSLSATYNSLQSPSINSLRASGILGRKASLSALTQGSLATIPDASESYGLSTVLDEDSPTTGRMGMAPHTPSAASQGDVAVGDLVDVPGDMYGTVRFVGSVKGKKGTFVGVELSTEFASKGKNNGDVEGVAYFRTVIDGAGIFLPLNRATRRSSSSNSTNSFPLTPNTPSANGIKVSNAYTPPTPSLPKFSLSQSVGPGRAPSPQFKKSRPSLPRPESPLRKPQLAAPAGRPSLSTPQTKGGIRYAPSPTPGKFGQSVRGTRDTGDPSKKIGFAPKPSLKASVGPRSASALGQNPINFSDEETTPIGVARTTDNGSIGSVSSFNAKMRPVEQRANEEEVARLRSQLEERDKQLKEQASALAEMESSLAEVQSLMNGSDAGGSRNNRSSLEDKDATQLRSLLREKNEKIAMLTAEFDAHRADFRSTIDTLELASTETERVYEKKVEDLLQEIRDLQDRTEDVDSVARQLKQLEELVQELEEGLEDARRGEAEARGEVEFLRGEVERGRSELRREREKAAAMLNGAGSTNGESTAKEVEQRDDEIRGLKAIIHSLSRDAVSDPDPQKTPTQRNGSYPRTRRTSQQSADERLVREKMERELAELRAIVETKNNREDELERELERLRRGSAQSLQASTQRASAMTVGSNGTLTQERSSIRDSKGTVVSWRDREALKSPEQHRRGNTLETMPESDTYSSATDGSTLWCEICETGGHDILTCTNMFGSKQSMDGTNTGDYAVALASPFQQRTGKDVVREGLRGLSPKPPGDGFAPAPLSPAKKASPRPPVAIIPNPMDQGPVAGKESGVVDANKWCALCERDGHESVDCPFENAF